MRPAEKRFSELTVVALADPNDLLSYRLLPSRNASPAVHVADVLVSNQPTYLGVLEDLATAHPVTLKTPMSRSSSPAGLTIAESANRGLQAAAAALPAIHALTKPAVRALQSAADPRHATCLCMSFAARVPGPETAYRASEPPSTERIAPVV